MIAARVLLAFWNQRGFWTTLARSYGLTGEDAELFVSTGLGIRRETAVTIYNEISRGACRSLVCHHCSHPRGCRREGSTDALEAVRRGIPGVMTAIAPGMHHQWNIENVELFNSSLRGWLDRCEVVEGLGASI